MAGDEKSVDMSAACSNVEEGGGGERRSAKGGGGGVLASWIRGRAAELSLASLQTPPGRPVWLHRRGTFLEHAPRLVFLKRKECRGRDGVLLVRY